MKMRVGLKFYILYLLRNLIKSQDLINTIFNNNYFKIINIKFKIRYFKFLIQFIFNILNLLFIEVDKQNIVYVNYNNNNIIREYGEINNDKFKIHFFKIYRKNIISNSRELF